MARPRRHSPSDSDNLVQDVIYDYLEIYAKASELAELDMNRELKRETINKKQALDYRDKRRDKHITGMIDLLTLQISQKTNSQGKPDEP